MSALHIIVEGYPAYAYTGGRAFDASGRVALLIHGAAFDHSVWQWQSRYLAHHGFAVLAVDLPGHGRSPGVPRQSIGAMAQWIAAFIEAAGAPQAAVVGHSMGSLVALETAIRFPRQVSRLALLGAAAPMLVGEPFLAAARDDSPAALDMEVAWGHARSSRLGQSPVPGMSLMGAARSLNDRAHAGVLHADLAACDAYAPAPESLQALRVPTLVLAGLGDQMTPMKSGKALAGAIAGARFVALDAGHSMMSEAPRATLEALRDFLA